MIDKRIHEGVLQCTVRVVTSKDKYNKIVMRHGGLPVGEKDLGCFTSCPKYWLLYIKESPDAQIIAHEANHIKAAIYEYKGIFNQDEEMDSYYLDWWVGKLTALWKS